MGNKYSSGKNAIAECDVCGFRYKLSELRELIVKTKKTNILACNECWDPDHPQLQLGMYPVDDPQAVMNPRPDSAGYYEQGNKGAGGSRMTQWGWNPVGGGMNIPGNNIPRSELIFPNALVSQSFLGTVVVTAT